MLQFIGIVVVLIIYFWVAGSMIPNRPHNILKKKKEESDELK